MTDPLGLKYGKIVGRFLANVADGVDSDDMPEFEPLSGTVTIKAEPPKILVPQGDPDPTTVVQLPDFYVCTLDDQGYLTVQGERGVRVIAPTPGTTNPDSFTYRVSFDLYYGTQRVKLAPFSFHVAEYIPGPDSGDPDTGSVGLTDLAKVSPVPGSLGNAVTAGVSVVDVDIVGDALVFTLSDGSSLPAVPVPALTAAADAAESAANSASDASDSADDAAAAVNSFTVTIGTVTTVPYGTPATATVHGGPPGWTLDLVLPTGPTGSGAADATTSSKGIVQLAGDLGGTAAAPTVPNKVQKLTPTAVKTGAYTAGADELIPVDTTSGAVTISLPSAPADKTRVFVQKIDTSSNAVTIARGGTDVFDKAGGATTHTLAIQNQGILLIYNSSAGIWYGDRSVPLSGLDTRFSALSLVTAVKTTTYTAAPGDFVPVDATSGAFTVTLPNAPADGTVVMLKKVDSSANTVTVSRSGSDVFNTSGGATTVAMTRQNNAKRFVYKASGGIWYETDWISTTDPRLSDPRTPAVGTSPYDFSIPAFGKATTRAVGTGDFPFGVKLQRAVTLSSVTYRGNTNGSSGNLVVELRKNGSTVSGSSATIAATSATTGGTATGSWSFAAGDILTVYITAADTGPGLGLIADIGGLA